MISFAKVYCHFIFLAGFLIFCCFQNAFQFLGLDGSGTRKKVRDRSGTGIPSDPDYYWYWYTICQLNQSFSNSEAAMRSTMLSWHTVWPSWPTLLLPAKWTQEKEKFTNIFLLWYTTVFKITQYLNVAHQRVCAVHVFFLKEIIKDFFTFIIWCHSSAATLLCLPEPWPRF